jgi:hypothetical protein
MQDQTGQFPYTQTEILVPLESGVFNFGSIADFPQGLKLIIAGQVRAIYRR